jgi:hypothetical protein
VQNPEKKWGALGACHALNALNARIFFSRCFTHSLFCFLTYFFAPSYLFSLHRVLHLAFLFTSLLTWFLGVAFLFLLLLAFVFTLLLARVPPFYLHAHCLSGSSLSFGFAVYSLRALLYGSLIVSCRISRWCFSSPQICIAMVVAIRFYRLRTLWFSSKDRRAAGAGQNDVIYCEK